jgi:three-Cys-motif partner protein
MKGNKAQNSVLPHSQAKLDLFRNYLMHYLRILSLASFCTKINLYDIFCGSGVYNDGKMGSPLIAKQCIKETQHLLFKLDKPTKPITLTINDKEEEKIQKVKQLLEAEVLEKLSINYFNEDADTMLTKAALEINSFPKTARTLVFIDPYGYSKIDKDKIYTILKNECSEVILFLPVMQMYRFTGTALTDKEKACYENLRKFIYSFFPSSHKIHQNGIENILEYINEIKVALTFENRFYSCSHYIEREKGNYYALFFITSNIYGLEKMLEAKWKMDPIKGKGFDQQKNSFQISMFTQEFEEQDKRKQLDYLARIFLNEINEKKQLTNNDIYKLSLLNEFMPKHAKMVLKNLVKGSIKAKSPSGITEDSEAGFGINYDNFRNNTVKVLFLNR